MSLTGLLVAETDASLRLASERLEGLSDDEFWWEPVPDCWTVRRADTVVPGALPPMGEWGIDGLFTYPQPPPFTTIGWRLNHMTIVMAGYHDLVGPLDVEAVAHGSAAEAAETWQRTAGSFREAVANLDDDAASALVHVDHWGRDVERWRVVGNVLREQVHHGAEIGCLRDLYRVRERS